MDYVFTRAEEPVSLNAQSVESMVLPQKVFFVHPRHFTIRYAINPHMRGSSGNLNTVNHEKAEEAWMTLVDVYRSLGLKTFVLEPLADCPDMVFCANQTLPFIAEDGGASVLLSKMHDPVRRDEVESIGKQLENLEIHIFPNILAVKDIFFEGMGDALWVPGRKLICGGHGFRSSEAAYKIVAEITKAHVVLFELPNPNYYHLDTCLSILSDRHVLATRAGFTSKGWENLHKLFDVVLEVPENEANSPGFACNAHCPDKKHVIIQQGNSQTERKLSSAGFSPIPVSTDEFIKSGGSVFCLKQMLF